MWIDLLILIAVGATVYHGWGSGFTRQLCGSLGFLAGIIVGRLIDPLVLKLIDNTNGRAAVTLVIILGAAIVGLGIGEYVGLHLKRRLLKKRYNDVDNGLGGVLTAILTFLSIWLLIAVIESLPSLSAGLQNQLRASRVLSGLNRLLPPASELVADISRLIDPNGYPDVFSGREPIPRGNFELPELGDLQPVVNAAKNSVVRVEGRGCGGLVSGSGFVTGDGVIATSAHVVAGIRNPYVEDSDGIHRAHAVSFNPNLDFALLRADDVKGRSLELNTAVAADGMTGAVLGYPGGGDFKAGPAAVIDQFPAIGHDIYGQGRSIRDIYSLKATVIPGNSGGPLIGADGRVLGMIFAESTSFGQVGYALIAKTIAPEIQRSAGQQTAVNTGQCAN